MRPFTLVYERRSLTFPMPSWHCDSIGESIFTRDAMTVSDHPLATLDAQVENLVRPEETEQMVIGAKAFEGGGRAGRIPHVPDGLAYRESDVRPR